MDAIAFIIGETFVYWNAIILVLSAVAAICLFLALYLRVRGSGVSAAVLVPLAMVFSIVIARFIHWYCRADAYESMEAAMTDYTRGGFALMGAFAGCALAAVLLRLIRVVKNLPRVFDCMAVAGAAGICVGRLSCLFTSADRGMVMEELRVFPIVYPVSNAVTGVVEWRLATFMLQSMAAGVIFLALLTFYLVGKRREKLKDGDTAWLFLSAYCATQVVLDSTRYDSLFMRSNGFISIVQILSAVALVGAVVYFSVRMVKARGFHWQYLLLWVMSAALVGGAGFMEYWVQRHGDLALFCYSIMSACLAGIVILTCIIRQLAVSAERKKDLVESNKK